MEPKLKNTASIQNGAYCKTCGWPIVFACCNDEMWKLHPTEDWWMYCSNQGCRHHKGEPYGQHHTPSFLGRITEMYECGGCGNEHPRGTNSCPTTGYPESNVLR